MARVLPRVEKAGRLVNPASPSDWPAGAPPVIGSWFPSVRARLDAWARARLNVLLLGETGVGKELVAKYLRAVGLPVTAPWVTVNCAAVAQTLLESELFGHVRGAFTGAVQTKAGVFLQAHRGGLFMDEVQGMSLLCQDKVLRVLSERRVRRLGGVAEEPADVWVVSASTSDLRALTQESPPGFKPDLYYRLRGVELRVPPLRERPKDILPLFQHFVELAEREAATKGVRLSRRAEAVLRRHAWPGNVRELANLAKQLVIERPGGYVTPPVLHDAFGTRAREPRKAKVPDAKILATVAQAGGDRARAAGILGIQPRSVRRRLSRMQPPPPAPPAGGAESA